MTVGCRKRGFPVRCPKCRRQSGRPNGRRQTVAQGVVQQVRCWRCKRQWIWETGDVGGLFSGQRVHLPRERLLKAFALMVLRVPMNTVEKLLGIKGESVKRSLEWLLRKERWELLDDVLERRFKIPQVDRSEFHRAIVVGRRFDPSAYRCWAREFGRLEPADRTESRRLIARILGRPLKAIMGSRRC
jgi:hypothetical protein